MYRWIDGRTDKRRRRDVSLLLPPPPFFTLRRNWCPAERSQDRLLLLLLSAFNHSSEREKKQNKTSAEELNTRKPRRCYGFQTGAFRLLWEKTVLSVRVAAGSCCCQLKKSKSTPDHFTSVSVTACNHTQPVAEKCAHVDKSANIK